ncbi:hypothetical protein AAIR29_05160 [Psychrobacter sp. FBL11]|uniref:Uncharacterized protein n=1 Tax=Psychrobacter saeujeotis TaxID=3143436 RepID=A0ABU9X6I7_9GAMM|nr:hypothetical protein [uncultured Psychrobacter sp.]
MTKMNALKRKAILIFKSEKRLGAARLVKTYHDRSFDEMKATIITESMCDSEALTHKPRTKDLNAHLDNLKHYFIGYSELSFYHATLVVLLRRKYKVAETFAEFEQLWNTETEYLLQQLPLRWLISACDTFIDHTSNTSRAAILMNAATLINTLRVYETKQFLQLGAASSPELNPVDTENVEALYRSDISLYDGLTYFRIGSDDTLINMRKRYESFYKNDELAATILLSIFDRLQTNHSAFHTMRTLHKSDRPKWWVE